MAVGKPFLIAGHTDAVHRVRSLQADCGFRRDAGCVIPFHLIGILDEADARRPMPVHAVDVSGSVRGQRGNGVVTLALLVGGPGTLDDVVSFPFNDMARRITEFAVVASDGNNDIPARKVTRGAVRVEDRQPHGARHTSQPPNHRCAFADAFVNHRSVRRKGCSK